MYLALNTGKHQLNLRVASLGWYPFFQFLVIVLNYQCCSFERWKKPEEIRIE